MDSWLIHLLASLGIPAPFTGDDVISEARIPGAETWSITRS